MSRFVPAGLASREFRFDPLLLSSSSLHHLYVFLALISGCPRGLFDHCTTLDAPRKPLPIPVPSVVAHEPPLPPIPNAPTRLHGPTLLPFSTPLPPTPSHLLESRVSSWKNGAVATTTTFEASGVRARMSRYKPRRTIGFQRYPGESPSFASPSSAWVGVRRFLAMSRELGSCESREGTRGTLAPFGGELPVILPQILP